MDRRSFLRMAGLAAGAAVLRPEDAFAADEWGKIPAGVWPAGDTRHPYKVLEIFLYGGMSAWETFYYRDVSGLRCRGFDAEINALAWQCSGSPSPPGEVKKFADDAVGKEIHLGPFTKPLWASHLLPRLRTIVLGHNLAPHEAAVPFSLAGLRLGRPQLAGGGAPIERRARVLAPARLLPSSYICMPSVINFPADNLQAATATGQHPGYARPLPILIGPGASSLRTRLERKHMTAGADALLRQYRSQYSEELMYRVAMPAQRIRSNGFADYSAALDSVLNAASLRTVLNSAPLALRTDIPCTGPLEPPRDNLPGTAIRFASYMLTRPAGQEARYVCVIDGGLVPATSGGGYDTHSNLHVESTSINFWNVAATLADVIKDPANPRPGDADRIDLDDTMIVLTTEFGRTPMRNFNGRDHWPSAYVNMLLGGPVKPLPAGANHPVAGAIDDATGRVEAGNNFTPTDFRAAVLLAAGVNPLDPDGTVYGVADVSSNVEPSPDVTARLVGLRKKILGVA